MNKNITLSVPEVMLKAVRRMASEEETTVNGLVRRYFEKLLAEKRRVSPTESRRRRQELEAIWERIDAKGGIVIGKKIPREALHDRRSLR